MGKSYGADIDNIIALCHIIDDFEEFRKNLISMIFPEFNRKFIFQLWDISKGKTKLGTRKAKKFYAENKSVVDMINQYSSITKFINLNYNCYGNCYGSLEFFYGYISKHRNEINKILNILEKLKELGFDEFEFNEDIDFTTEDYSLLPTFRDNSRLIYVDNIEVSPSYSKQINYHTTSSNYKMNLSISGEDFSKYHRTIILNSLLFDLERLPENIDKTEVFDGIIGLKQENQAEAIRNSVNLSVSISDLGYQLSLTNDVFNRLNGVENKEQLLQVLLNIKLDIDKLKTLSEEYDKSVIEKDSLITPDILEREKTLYLRRREWEKMDIH